MQRRIQIASLLAVVTFFSGCWKKAEEVKNDALSENAATKLINVLDSQYFEDAHIPGSLNISLDNLEEATKDWNKDSDIVVYCANYHCSASAAAARKLAAAGFTHVKAYEAGMADWAQKGLPVEGPAQEAYLTQPNEKVEHAQENNDESEDASKTENDVVEISTDELADVLGVQKASN